MLFSPVRPWGRACLRIINSVAGFLLPVEIRMMGIAVEFASVRYGGEIAVGRPFLFYLISPIEPLRAMLHNKISKIT